MYTSTAPPLPVSSDVYVYVLYTYTQIWDHACTMYAFYTAKIHQKQGIFLMYATENDVYIKLLYAHVYVARQHRAYEARVEASTRASIEATSYMEATSRLVGWYQSW